MRCMCSADRARQGLDEVPGCCGDDQEHELTMARGFMRTLLELPPLPDSTRRSFRREQLTQLALPPAFALMEGGIVGVIADKMFHVSPWLLAVITAAPMFGNLMSFVWSRVALARPKVPVIVALQCGVLACIAAVALLPVDALGASLLALTMVTARLLMSGVTTVRSVVWSLNYGRELRARTTARLQILSSLFTAISSFLVGTALDANPDNFRWVYLTGVCVGACGVLAFSRVRVQREHRHLVVERTNQRGGRQAQPIGFFEILRGDALYRRYQLFQFTSGAAAMMTIPALILYVSREMQASFLVSFLLINIVPLSLSVLSMPLWAQFLDRVHVTRFRARQSILWVLEPCVIFLGASLGSLWIIAVGRMINGVSNGGGSLAWELGHNDFAPKQQVGAYMSVHVTLTGVRGATAPFIGAALYHGWPAGGLAGAEWPAFDGIGRWLFLVSAVLMATSWRGFNRLAQDMGHMRLRPPSSVADDASVQR